MTGLPADHVAVVLARVLEAAMSLEAGESRNSKYYNNNNNEGPDLFYCL
jgi:hypothetical protein